MEILYIKFVLLLFCFIGAISCQGSDFLESKFQKWMKEHQRWYDSQYEYQMRLAIFKENSWMVDQHNKRDHSYELELNEYSDMRDEEFSKKFLINTPQKCSATKGNHQMSEAQLPKAVDWRQRGVVSGVKNQGHCGSCWTFSTTGAMESHMAISYHRMFNLSEQQLVDCAQAFNNHGCEGGLPSQAFEYIHYNKGLETEKTYPYTAKDGHCKFQASDAVAFVSNVVNITQYDEDQLTDAVATRGPVSIAFQVAKDFRFYKKGVYKSNICLKDPMHVNHAVLAVGYNVTEQGEKYWIVKNSWGTKFGMNGYFWIERGSNMCGLADCASYPQVSDQP